MASEKRTAEGSPGPRQKSLQDSSNPDVPVEVILNTSITRRKFLGAGVAATTVLAVSAPCHGQALSKETVRCGIIGVGGRGTGLLKILLQRPETQIVAICDINQAHLDRALAIVQQAKGNLPAGYAKDEYDYRNMLQRDDFDVVLIATSIKWHGVMSVDAMNAGKHVGSEVPACQDLKECAAMVAAKEQNGVRYMLLENYLYFRENMAVLEMTRRGLWGQPYFAECGYIHEYKTGQYEVDGSLNWRGELMQYTHGNHYPTHSGGPIFKWLGVNDGDRLQRLTCYATEPNRSAPVLHQTVWRRESIPTAISTGRHDNVPDPYRMRQSH